MSWAGMLICPERKNQNRSPNSRKLAKMLSHCSPLLTCKWKEWFYFSSQKTPLPFLLDGLEPSYVLRQFKAASKCGNPVKQTKGKVSKKDQVGASFNQVGTSLGRNLTRPSITLGPAQGSKTVSKSQFPSLIGHCLYLCDGQLQP